VIPNWNPNEASPTKNDIICGNKYAFDRLKNLGCHKLVNIVLWKSVRDFTLVFLLIFLFARLVDLSTADSQVLFLSEMYGLFLAALHFAGQSLKTICKTPTSTTVSQFGQIVGVEVLE